MGLEEKVLLNRIGWIDISKAICIYFVVLGHALTYNEPYECFFRNFIYVFHLPVFFFVSGYLFSNKKHCFSSFLLVNIKSLLLPYIFLNLLALIINYPHVSHHGLKQSLIFFITGHGYAPAGPAWFLLCLFWVRLQMYYIVRCRLWLITVLFFIYGVLAYFFPLHLYWDIDASFMAMPIVIVGYLSRRYIAECINNKQNKIKLLLVFFVSFALTLLCTSIQQKEAMYSRLFGEYGIVFYIGAFVGIIMIISISKYLEKYNNKIVSVISSGSIIIMGLHGAFYIYTFKIFNKLSLFSSGSNILLKIIICLLVMAEMYYPIMILQKHFSYFLGGRKVK